MTKYYWLLIPALWIAWALYWWLSASGVKDSVRTEPLTTRASHAIPLIVVILLLALPALPGEILNARILPAGPETFWTGVAVLVAGLAFMVWARTFLGRNWSATVTIKRDHELIRGGPYRFVRHPIYTGALIGIIGTAIARGELRGLLAVLIVFAALWRKLRIEERWLGETFGEDYAKYRTEVAALIPFLL
jgi:protein-S-isoprenylcysteine O-methyltransferase Ste14